MTNRFWIAAVAALVTLPLACGSASAALTGQYLFEEGSGSMANDTSGLNRHGTLTGGPVLTPAGQPDYVAGIYTGSNSALRFNYDSTTMGYVNAQVDRVALPESTAFVQNAQAMTLMAWVRPDVIANQGGTNPQVGSSRSIVGVSESAGGTRGILQLLSASGQVRVLGRSADGGGNANYVTNGATPFAAQVGQTYFLVGVLDYANQIFRAYINGVEHTGGTMSGATNLSAPSVDAPNLRALIGTNTLGEGEQWNGLIDGVRIYDHGLTASEILAIYDAEKILLDANFDNDNAVNGNDLLIWQRGLGKGPTPPAVNGDGDANGDGIVNNADLTAWRNTFGPASVAAASAVPEPAAATLAAIFGLALAARRRR
jgi:hypothetical protein